VRRRLVTALALLALMTLGPLGAACGAPARAARYEDRAHGISLVYDASQFGEGTLAASALITAAERAVGGEHVAVVEVTASDLGAQATGVRVAVFEAPRDVTALGFWRVTDQLLEGYLPRARAAVAPGVTIGEPFRVTVAGLQGYAATFVVASPEEPATGIGLALSRAPYIYEVVVLCRAADRRLLDELTQMLVDLRLGSGPPLATP